MKRPFAVIRSRGPAWNNAVPLDDQVEWTAHAAFMNGLAEEGLVLAAGPLAGTESARIRVLLIADANNEAEITQRLANDPWEQTNRITTTNVEPWTLFVGALPAAINPPA